MFSLFGFGGQHAYEWLDAMRSEKVREAREVKEKGEETETLMQRLGKSKWSPMRTLSNEEYEALMREKILKVEVEIALLKDRIETLKKEKVLEEAKKKEIALEEAKKAKTPPQPQQKS